MLRAPLAGFLVLTLAASARADTQPYRVVVIDEEVKHRAGPSDNFPETGTLRKGESVLVEKEAENGWLAVSPYGSISWVAATFIEDPAADKPAPKNVFVSGEDDVTIASGRVGLNQPLDIRRVKIPHGTALLVLGPKVTFSGRFWYPILSPPGDVRYIPKSAVQFEKAASPTYTIKVNESVTPLPPGSAGSSGSSSNSPATPAGGSAASVSGPNVTPVAAGVTASKPAVNHPLWAQAEAAERDNRLFDAEKLYFQLAEEMNRANGDHDIANLCYTRIHAIREKQRGTRGTGAPPSTPSALKPPVKDDSAFRPAAKEDRGVRVGTPEALPPAADKDEAAEWQTGTLKRSNLTPDGPNRQLYMLEAPQGIVKMYVTAAPGVDLNRYLGKRVSVLGSATSRTGLSKPYLVATAVEAAQ